MKMVLSSLLVLSLACTSLGQVQRRLGWRDLTAQKNIPRYEYGASEALNPEWKQDGIILLSQPEWLLDFAPEIAGKLALSFKVASGGGFGPYSIFLNGKSLGRIASTDEAVTQLEKSFLTDHVSSQSNRLRIAVPSGRKIGLSAISWRPAEWRGTPAAKLFYLYNPIPRRCFIAKVAADKPLTLQINGKQVDLQDGYGWIPWRYLNKGLNKIQVETEADWTLQFNRVDDVKFFETLPGILSPPAHEPRTYQLGNDRLKLVVSGDNYYMGNRFESPGMMTSVVYDGHECASSLLAPHDPFNDNSGAGPAQEFSEAIGYATARPGEPFLKVGVGLYEKACDQDYSFAYGYFPVKRFDWKVVDQRPDRIAWRQAVQGPDGWGYDYTKTIILGTDTAEFCIRHTLKNTGTKRLLTSQYNHNVFKLGAGPIGEDDSVSFNFPMSGKHIYGSKAVMTNDGFSFSRFSGNYFARLTGFTTVDHNQAILRNNAYNIGLTISGDFVPFKIFFYATDDCVCPEFFKRIDLPPGNTASWTRRYQFFKQ